MKLSQNVGLDGISILSPGTHGNSVKRPKSGPGLEQTAVSQPVTSNFYSNSLRILVLVASTHMQNMKVGFRVRFRDVGLGTQENSVTRPNPVLAWNRRLYLSM